MTFHLFFNKKYYRTYKKADRGSFYNSEKNYLQVSCIYIYCIWYTSTYTHVSYTRVCSPVTGTEIECTALIHVAFFAWPPVDQIVSSRDISITKSRLNHVTRTPYQTSNLNANFMGRIFKSGTRWCMVLRDPCSAVTLQATYETPVFLSPQTRSVIFFVGKHSPRTHSYFVPQVVHSTQVKSCRSVDII